jgi:hypothetical protein
MNGERLLRQPRLYHFQRVSKHHFSLERGPVGWREMEANRYSRVLDSLEWRPIRGAFLDSNHVDVVSVI